MMITVLGSVSVTSCTELDEWPEPENHAFPGWDGIFPLERSPIPWDAEAMPAVYWTDNPSGAK